MSSTDIHPHRRRYLYGGSAIVLLVLAVLLTGLFSPAKAERPLSPKQQTGTAEAKPDYRYWWTEGRGGEFAAYETYNNAFGRIGIINAKGPVNTEGHPFFEPVGTNGRACISCHQPADGMSLSTVTIQERWRVTGGKDPIFAAIDGSNCPHLPQDEASSHSLLLERGLFRVFVPWPPKATDGATIKPEFTLEVVADPTGCNTHPEYGLASDNPMVSVYRRPRVMANMRYIISGGALFNIKDGSLMSKDPETGKPVSMQLMADAREPTLKTQAVSAAKTHLQASGLSEDQLQQIGDFQTQIYMAQSYHVQGGDLTAPGGPTALGPRALLEGEFGLGDNFDTPLFGDFSSWAEPQPGETAEQREFRESVIRGHEVFFLRTFWIRDITHLNSIGLGNPIKRTCATCHNSKMAGLDVAPGWMDLGTTNMPWARTANNISNVRAPWANPFDMTTAEPPENVADRTEELPLFKLTCNDTALPHAYLGRVIYTQDPGRALTTGRCSDIGAITIQQMRGLAARAPYFSNGAARTLEELVDYYDQRFNIRYSEQDKKDLVNFMSVL